ncbi:MAG TPA: acetate--CoA ligase family protein, partial [Bacillota bacterium]|nr:acetate--CoA ligase family protein [Bacillota bacterium]
MQLLEARFYPGKNIYCYRPVIKGQISLGQWVGYYTDELGSFGTNLEEVLPGLEKHTCSRGYRGGFLERLKEGTYLGHVLEHVALELLTLAGIRADFGKTLATGAEDIYEVIIEAPNAELGQSALLGAVDLLNGLLRGETPCLEDILPAISRIAARTELGPTTAEIVRAAKARGIPITRLNDCSLIQLGYGKNLKRIEASLTDATSAIAVDISCDKQLTRELLGRAAIPVPAGGVAETVEQALAMAGQLGFPVAVKPVDGNQGRGVMLDLRNEGQLVKAVETVMAISPRFIVEKYISGKQYRCLIIGGKFVAAAQRIGPQVEGDGQSSVARLIAKENRNPLRGENHEKPLSKIKPDEAMILCLNRQGLSLTSVPQPGKKVLLRDNANLSCGAIAVDVTDSVCAENRQMVERAVRLTGLDVAGVDLVAGELSQPIRPSTGAVIEINAAPGFRMHTHPTAGEAREVGNQVIDWLFPKGTGATVPIVSVTGTNGKTTTTRMIAHILQSRGQQVGV